LKNSDFSALAIRLKAISVKLNPFIATVHPFLTGELEKYLLMEKSDHDF
jgi:hypothetical protein